MNLVKWFLFNVFMTLMSSTPRKTLVVKSNERHRLLLCSACSEPLCYFKYLSRRTQKLTELKISGELQK
jgi:hypothetical protein